MGNYFCGNAFLSWGFVCGNISSVGNYFCGYNSSVGNYTKDQHPIRPTAHETDDRCEQRPTVSLTLHIPHPHPNKGGGGEKRIFFNRPANRHVGMSVSCAVGLVNPFVKFLFRRPTGSRAYATLQTASLFANRRHHGPELKDYWLRHMHIIRHVL